MRSFTQAQLSRPVPPGLVWLVGEVMESRGRQRLFEQQRPEALETLRQIALIQSAESSNRIEGVTVERARLTPLVLGKTAPRDRSEEEIVGYRRALSWIHERQEALTLTPSTLRELHKLAQEGVSGDAGQYKRLDNDIIEVWPDGRRHVRFQTLPKEQVEDAIEQLCLAYQHALNDSLVLPILAIASAVFDFLCIHPFRDGNGRVSRLLTLLLLYQHQFRVGRFVSLERVIEQTKQGYYDALYASSQGWHQGHHDLVPWWSYFLSTLRRAYGEFEQSVEQATPPRGAKTQLIEQAIDAAPRAFVFSDLTEQLPHISKEQIRKVLRRMRDDGLLSCQGQGRGALWQKAGTDPNK
jgi:Fic family protein